MPSPEFKDPPPKGKFEILFGPGFLLLFLGGMAMETLDHYTPAKLAMWLTPAFYILLLPVHEFGHALAARLCGWGIREVVIGTGPEWLRRPCLGSTLSLRAFPVSGHVSTRIGDLRFAAWKSAFIYAAGPGIEILLLLAVWLAAGNQLLAPQTEPRLIAAQSFALAALLGIVFNLIPYPVRTADGDTWSDGLGVIQSLRTPPEDYARLKRRQDFEDAGTPIPPDERP